MQNIISGFNAKSKGKGLTIYDNPLGVDNLILDHGDWERCWAAWNS